MSKITSARGRGIIKDFNSPLVSFIIPVLNSEKTLDRCLKSIISQDYPHIEILVIDNGCTDSTIEIAKRYGVNIYCHKGPLGDVRRLGIDTSSGELIALWDSDIYIPDPTWLSQSLNVLYQFPKASTLWIRTIPLPDAVMIAKAYDWLSWTIMLDLVKKRIGFWGGGASLFRRKAIEDVDSITKGFDTGEDFNLAQKLSLKGYEVVFYNEPVYHDSHNTFTELVHKDLRRAKNFKQSGLTVTTGIPFRELILVNMKVGLLLPLINLFKLKDSFYGIVPIILFIRILVYLIRYLLS